ncbi:hypothetical protein Scep_017036 [Stephania cephalantha]|uniref:Uncharacterized protein n=1 Tax=Stephania cephalantha TaxID=152367 RepID=A0AAP0NTV8_9MAGN
MGFSECWGGGALMLIVVVFSAVNFTVVEGNYGWIKADATFYGDETGSETMLIGSGVVREALHEEFEWRDRRGRSLRRGYRFEDEDRVVGDQCAAALAADDRVLDEFPIAGEADRLDYRRGVFLNAVTNRIIRIGRSGTIIIDAETAPTSITLIPAPRRTNS